MEGNGGKQDEILSRGTCGGHKTKATDIIKARGKETLGRKAGEGQHLRIYAGLRDGNSIISEWPIERREMN